MERARKKEEGEEEKSRYFILFFWRAPRQETQIRIKGDRRRERREGDYLEGQKRRQREIPFAILLFSFHFVLAFWPVGSILSHPARYIVIHNTAYTHTFKNNHTVEYSKREIKKMD